MIIYLYPLSCIFFCQAEDEESVLIKPRARSTASGKKIPAGAVSIFGGVFNLPLVVVLL